MHYHTIQTTLFLSMFLCFGIIQVHSQALDVINSTGDTLLHVNNNGHVGIGTASPSERLDIKGFLKIEDGALQSGVKFHRSGQLKGDITSHPDGLNIRAGNGGSVFINGDSSSDAFVVTDDGHVGIGTSNPVAGRIHVAFALDNQNLVGLLIDNNQAPTPGSTSELAHIVFRVGGPDAAVFRVGRDADFTTVDNEDSFIAFLNRHNGVKTERVRISSGGNFGIGTTNPMFRLHVNGSAGKPGGGSWSSASDARLKDIKGHFTRGLDAIDKLNPVHYSYKKDNPIGLPPDEEYMGLIAQEVQEVIPEAVGEYEDGYLSVSNDPIIWTMLNAIKELKAENERMKAKVAELVQQSKKLKEMETLKSEMAEIKKTLRSILSTNYYLN